MPRITKKQVQLLIVALVGLAWVASLIVAVTDGSTVLKAVTPVMTLVFGWLFAERATNGD